MNYSLMLEHIDGSFYENINPVLADDKSNINHFYMADVIGNRRFVQNYGGYPRSDISQILDLQDLNQQALLLNELTDYSSDSNPNAGLSDAEIMLGHRSKYCQTASEQVAWLENQLHERDVRRQVQQMNEKKSAEDKIEFNSDNV